MNNLKSCLKSSVFSCLILDKECNPSISAILNKTGLITSENKIDGSALSFDYKSVIALFVFLICVLYSRFVNFEFIQKFLPKV